MVTIINSREISVGDIISEQGVISDMWNKDYPDNGTEYNEFSRFIVLEKIMAEDTPMILTGANEYYFKIRMIYMIPEIMRLYTHNSCSRATITDHEIDDEDREEAGPTLIGDPRPNPRQWLKVS